MDNDTFLPRINTAARPRIGLTGRDKSPVTIIDDVLSNPEALKAEGQASTYSTEHRTFYPGHNGVIARESVLSVISALKPVIENVYDLPLTNQIRLSGYFGLVSTPPERLHLAQTIPHYDTTNPRMLAVLIYLSGPPHGGTGFYRHKATGIERMTLDNIADYNTALADEMAERDALPRRYFDNSDDQFTCIGKVDAAYNRAVIYPANLLHSGLIDPAHLSDDPHKGRITANMFLTMP